MPFTPKVWKSETNPLGPPADSGTATPISGPELEDLEIRLSNYVATSVPISVKDPAYGAVGNGTVNDTAAIQAAINAAAASGITGGGGVVFFPPGDYSISTLLYKTGVTLRGSGRNNTWLRQRNGTADVLLRSADNTISQPHVVVEDLAFTSFDNQIANTGGIKFEGTASSHIRRCRFTYFNNAAIKLLGGANQGDTMYNAIEHNYFEQALTGSKCIWLSNNAAGGSHPDGTKVQFNTANIASTVEFLHIDAAAINDALALGPDACRCFGNDVIGSATPVNIQGGQKHRVTYNRFEVVSGTMQVIVANGQALSPVVDTMFGWNEYATYGDPTQFTFTDTSSDGASRWGEVYDANLAANGTGTKIKGSLWLAGSLLAGGFGQFNAGTSNRVSVGLSGAGSAYAGINFGFGNEDIHLATGGRMAIGSADLAFDTTGTGLMVKEGINAKMGTATLNGTTEVTVTTNKVTANSRILLTIQTPGGTVGAPYVSSRSAGTSFGVKSTNAADTSTVAWMIIEPSP